MTFRLYFGTTAATITTALIACIFTFIGLCITRRNSIQHWGRLIFLLAALALVACCFAAMRQGGYYYSVQDMVEHTGTPGIFSALGLHAKVGGMLAIGAVVLALISVFMKSQNSREVLFFVISAVFTSKIIFIEASRIFALINK